MALPPCHMLCQFYVTLPPASDLTEKPKLSCLMFQRAANLGLGIPFNIASYALLTHMIARVTDTQAHELIIQLGDAHVYRDHVDALQEQLKRCEQAPDKLWIPTKAVKIIIRAQSSIYSSTCPYCSISCRYVSSVWQPSLLWLVPAFHPVQACSTVLSEIYDCLQTSALLSPCLPLVLVVTIDTAKRAGLERVVFVGDKRNLSDSAFVNSKLLHHPQDCNWSHSSTTYSSTSRTCTYNQC